MSLKHELSNAKTVFKTGTGKQKLEFIWDYYKLPLVCILLVLIVGRQLIISTANAKEYVLQGVFLNSVAETNDVQLFEDGYLAQYPIDSSKEAVYFDTSLYYSSSPDGEKPTGYYESMQVLVSRIAAGDVDFLIADIATMKQLAYSQIFYSLSDVLSDELMREYESSFLYCDGAVVDKVNSIDYLDISVPDILFPDPSDPHLMDNPIPIMINITTSDNLSAFYPYDNQQYAIAFVINSRNLEKALSFLDYLSR